MSLDVSNINKPVRAGHLLDSLYRCIRESKGIGNIPGLLKQILKDNLWKEVYIKEFEKTVTYERFEDFVTGDPPEGLGTTTKFLLNICKEDEEVYNMIDMEVKRRPGKLWDSRTTEENTVYNVHNNRPTGNSQQAGIRRLRAEIDKAKSPEKRERVKALQKQVFNNEISLNQALISIGARKETTTIRIDPKSAAKTIKKKFNKQQVLELIKYLSSEQP